MGADCVDIRFNLINTTRLILIIIIREKKFQNTKNIRSLQTNNFKQTI